MKLVEIAQSWYQFAAGEAPVQALMERRLKVCDTCTYKRQLNWIGELLLTGSNEQGSVYKCGICKCPLGQKTARFANECPKGFWKAEAPPAGYY